jgi:Cu(I)/Ag(I) efflux system membrane fusion protein
MHTSVRSEMPGNCPICSMNLVPVTKEEVETGVITIDAKRRQTIGVTVEPVVRRPLTLSVRAVGRVAYDDSRLADVTLKLRGWVGELYVDTLGQRVRQGEPLFTLYSPEVYAAQEELLAAVASQKAARSGAAPERADYLVDAARRRLRLWDIEAAQVERVLRQGKPLEYIPIASPVSGYVIEKNVVQGATVEPGARLYRIAGLDQVWVEAEVYESDLELIGTGDLARVTLPYSPGHELQGQVAFVYPYLDDATRTGRIRIELSNPDLALKPDMYANVELEKSLGELLAVPEDAVLYAGLRSFVFIDLGEGRLRPKAVVLGRKAGDFVEVREGLAEGDQVVTSGTFLVAAESRLKRDMEHWQ